MSWPGVEYNSRKIKSNPGDFLDFSWLRMVTSFSGVKGSENVYYLPQVSLTYPNPHQR